jgi:hypothetical protein
MKTSGSVQEFERELLSSARADRVPDGARERVAGRLGLLGLAGPRASDADHGPAGAAALTKPALLGVAGVGVLGLALWGALPAAPPGALSDVPALQTTAAALPPALIAVPTTAVVEPPARTAASRIGEPTALPAARRVVRQKNKSVASTSAAMLDTSSRTKPSSSEGLLEEVKQLDRARGDLASERASLALAVLDDYERRFPAGQLALEASVLRASTLAANGRVDEARTLARRLLAQSGSARYRAELRPIAGYERRAGDIEGAR